MPGAFDAAAYDNVGYYTGASTPVAPPSTNPGAGGGGRREPPALIAPFITWGKKRKKKEEQIEEVQQAIQQALIIDLEPLPEIDTEILAERLLAAQSLTQLRRIKRAETLMALIARELQEIEDEDDLLLLS